VGLVLIADDEPALLESLCDVVEGLGYECVAAHDGDELFDLARARRPDLVITDYMMPGKNGIEAIRALRATDGLAHVPVILVSAGVPRGFEEAWRFLSKPIELGDFQQFVTEGLRVSRERNGGEIPPPDPPVSPLSLAREEMLNWVAHEIKSPLSAAMMSAQLIRRGLDSGEKAGPLRRRIEIVVRQLQRMDELVVSILDAARLQEGKLGLKATRVDMCELLARAAEFWRESYPENKFELNVPDTPMFVHADSERVRQVLDNLVSNAVKYGQPSLLVQLELAMAGDQISVRVTDHGRGIPGGQVAQLFDRFHRVGAGGRGHGLGLFIARALARLHGGELHAASDEGRGSTFTLSLPRNGHAAA
jgi:signal transduction histidine kinase